MEVQSYLPTPPNRCIWLLRMNKLKPKYNVKNLAENDD